MISRRQDKKGKKKPDKKASKKAAGKTAEKAGEVESEELQSEVEEAPAETQPEQPQAEGAPGAESQSDETRLTADELKASIEAVLFAAGEGVPRKRLRRIFREASKQEIDDAILRLEGELVATGRAFGIVEDATGIKLLTRSEFAPFVARLRGEKRRVRLSQAAFETLAVIAYRQPIRRSDLETIRGVQCGAILKNLSEWNLIRVTGRDESLGRPLLYGTSSTFLEQFGLASLKELPEPDRLQEVAGASGLEVVLDNASQLMFDMEEHAPPPEEGDVDIEFEKQEKERLAAEREAAKAAAEEAEKAAEEAGEITPRAFVRSAFPGAKSAPEEEIEETADD